MTVTELAVRAQLAVGSLLADGSSPSDIDPTTGKGPEWGKASPIGLLMIVLLCIAGYFLARSMSRHLRKVQRQAEAAQVPAPAETAAEAADVSAGAEPDEAGDGDGEAVSPANSAGPGDRAGSSG